jgi:hypothetical protein
MCGPLHEPDACAEAQAELAVASGSAPRRGPLRRHVEWCGRCQAFEAEVRRQRVLLAIVLPVTPTAALEGRVRAAIAVPARGDGARPTV